MPRLRAGKIRRNRDVLRLLRLGGVFRAWIFLLLQQLPRGLFLGARVVVLPGVHTGHLFTYWIIILHFM